MLKCYYRKLLSIYHPDTLETIEKELKIIAEYDDEIEMLKNIFNEKIIDPKNPHTVAEYEIIIDAC